MTVPPRVAVLASRVRAEEKRLLDAFERRRIPVEQVDTRRLAFGLEAAEPPWRLVLNREISASRARHAAYTLESLGAVVANSAAATEVCADKWLTSLALRRAGVPTPRTTLALTPEAALSEVEAMGYPVIVKPLTSSWGRRISLVRDADAARAVLEHCAALPSPQAHLIYLQQFVDKPGRDIRVVVAGGQALAASYRFSTDWRTNVAQGGRSEPCPMTPELSKLAVASAHAVDADFAGVDIVEDRDGTPLVLEVNHNVEFSGIQHAHGQSIDIAGTLVEVLMSLGNVGGGAAP